MGTYSLLVSFLIMGKSTVVNNAPAINQKTNPIKSFKKRLSRPIKKRIKIGKMKIFLIKK